MTAPKPLPPSDPAYRKPDVEHNANGTISVWRCFFDRCVTRYEVARLAPDEVEALRVFLDGWRGAP